MVNINSNIIFRQWNLVEVNVTRDELSKALKERIIHLIYPLTSVLDSDLAAVLWFGARGQEQVNGNNYHSACRVSLISLVLLLMMYY